MDPTETTPENTTPVDETEVSDTELENISGGTAGGDFTTNPNICVPWNEAF